MYDINLTVPNFTSEKYSDDNRFLLLKNYLYELNETLAHALAEKEYQDATSFSQMVEAEGEKQQINLQQLQSQTVSRLGELKEKILRTIEELDVTSENVDELRSELEAFKAQTKSQFASQTEEIYSQIESVYATKKEALESESRLNLKITQNEAAISSVKSELDELAEASDIKEAACEATDLAEIVSGSVRYFPRLNAVFLRLKVKSLTELTPGTAHRIACVPDYIPELLSPLGGYADIDCQCKVAVFPDNGDVVIKSNTTIPAGSVIYINGSYILY